MSGYIAIQRGLLEHPLFKPEPFTEREAWIWLIEGAAWRSTRVRIGAEIVSLGRGELAHSVRFMAKAWQWEQTKVWRFLKKLRTNGMIKNAQENYAKITTANATATQHQTQRISICNYDKYQPGRNGDETETATPNATGPQQDRNKEETLKHLNKEIDIAGEVFDAIAKIAKVPSDDPSLWGFNHQIDAMLTRGFPRETILAGAANAMRGKSKTPPWAYFAKCIETENEQRSSPAKKERGAFVPSVQVTPDARAVEFYKKFGRWHRDYGPEPGKPGCRASPELLAKFGYQSEAAA